MEDPAAAGAPGGDSSLGHGWNEREQDDPLCA